MKATAPVHARDVIVSARAQTSSAYRRLADAATLLAMVMDDPTSTPSERHTRRAQVQQRIRSVKAAEEYYGAVCAGAAQADGIR